MMTFTAGVLNIILNLVLIPYLGIYACALSTVACLLLMPLLGSSFKSFRQLNKVPFNFLALIGIIIDCGGTALLLQNQPLWIKFLVLALFYLGSFRYIYSFYLTRIKPIRVGE